MDRKYVLDALELQNQRAIYHEIGAVPAIQIDSLVFHRQGHLSFEGYSTQVMKFVAQTLFISRFH